MIGEWHGGPMCVGYAEFHKRRGQMAPWLARLERDLRELAAADEVDEPRLLDVQHRLVELIQKLDSENVRYGSERLQRACSGVRGFAE